MKLKNKGSEHTGRGGPKHYRMKEKSLKQRKASKQERRKKRENGDLSEAPESSPKRYSPKKKKKRKWGVGGGLTFHQISKSGIFSVVVFSILPFQVLVLGSSSSSLGIVIVIILVLLLVLENIILLQQISSLNGDKGASSEPHNKPSRQPRDVLPRHQRLLIEFIPPVPEGKEWEKELGGERE